MVALKNPVRQIPVSINIQGHVAVLNSLLRGQRWTLVALLSFAFVILT